MDSTETLLDTNPCFIHCTPNPTFENLLPLESRHSDNGHPNLPTGHVKVEDIVPLEGGMCGTFGGVSEGRLGLEHVFGSRYTHDSSR